MTERFQQKHDDEVTKNFQIIESLMPELIKEHKGQEALMRHGKIVRFFTNFSDAYDFALKKFPDLLFSIQPIPTEEFVEVHGVLH